ncbi:MAG: intradiol ring-cleavage dioxygenase [Planctomycetota bacterium]
MQPREAAVPATSQARLDALVARRRVLEGFALGAAAWLVPGVFAEALDEQLPLTPRQTEGPFYPDRLPLDRDNDLVIVGDRTTPALGRIVHLSGRVLTPAGSPVRNAFVEIWQVDNNGAYIHSRSSNRARRDPGFQGYGHFVTNAKGEYRFRTILPVAYPGRTPHIHVAVSHRRRRVLTTQLYTAGVAQNARDRIYRSLGAAGQRLVTVDYRTVADSKIGELDGRKDLVVGVTPTAD